MEEILDYVDAALPGNCAAKAAVDIALHDLVGKLLNQPWYRIWGYSVETTPLTTFTIGIDKGAEVIAKTKEASAFKILKVKIGGGNDEEMIKSVRSVTNVPLCVDVNQGWKDRQEALDKIHWLKEQGVVLWNSQWTNTTSMTWPGSHRIVHCQLLPTKPCSGSEILIGYTASIPALIAN